MSDFETTKMELQNAINMKQIETQQRLSALSNSIEADYNNLLSTIDYDLCKNKILDDINGIKKMKYETISYMVTSLRCSICTIDTWDLKHRYPEYRKLEDVSKVLKTLNISKRLCPDESMILESKLKQIQGVDLLEWRITYKYHKL